MGDAPPSHPAGATWRDVWADAAEAVGDRTRARWICETAAGADGADFLVELDEVPTDRMLAHLDAMLARAATGEPLQYVIGRWGFRRLDLAVDARVLIPRPETELVAEVAIDLAARAGPTRAVADLGSGSGAIGLAMADELPIVGTTVWLTDADPDALDVARSNLAGIGRAAGNVRVASGDWCGALPADVRFDVVVANPPYVAEGSRHVEDVVSGWEPHRALFAGPDGLDAIRSIVACVPAHLRPGGHLVLEIGAGQGPDVAELLTAAGFVDLDVRADLAGHDRIVVGRQPETIVRDGDLEVRHLLNRPDEYDRMLRWLSTPEVLEWYAGRDSDYDADDVQAEYGPGGETEREGTTAAVAVLDGRPIGYVQLYELTRWAADFGLTDGRGVWSLDLFVGETDLHGQGVGRRIVKATAEHLLRDRDAREVVIMPYPENTRAVASYRAAGFVADGIVPDHEVHEGVMRDGLRMVYRPDGR